MVSDDKFKTENCQIRLSSRLAAYWTTKLKLLFMFDRTKWKEDSQVDLKFTTDLRQKLLERRNLIKKC